MCLKCGFSCHFCLAILNFLSNGQNSSTLTYNIRLYIHFHKTARNLSMYVYHLQFPSRVRTFMLFFPRLLSIFMWKILWEYFFKRFLRLNNEGTHKVLCNLLLTFFHVISGLHAPMTCMHTVLILYGRITSKVCISQHIWGKISPDLQLNLVNIHMETIFPEKSEEVPLIFNIYFYAHLDG
jgi:hypothetical protein